MKVDCRSFNLLTASVRRGRPFEGRAVAILIILFSHNTTSNRSVLICITGDTNGENIILYNKPNNASTISALNNFDRALFRAVQYSNPSHLISWLRLILQFLGLQAGIHKSTWSCAYGDECGFAVGLQVLQHFVLSSSSVET